MRAELGPVRARGGDPGGFTNLTEVRAIPKGKKWIYKKSISSSGTKNWFFTLLGLVGKQSSVGTTNPPGSK